MSPITHSLIGWTISQPIESKKARGLITLASIFPDIDGLTLLGGIELYHEYHHTFGHNVFLATGFSSLAFFLKDQKAKVFALTFASFHSHLFCDLLGSGADWGIYYLWPLSRWEITSFPPFQWELESWQNILTTVIFMIVVGWIGIRKGRTVVELFSERVDGQLVKVLRDWKRKIS